MIGDFMFFMILVEWYILWVRFWNRFRGTQTLNVNLYIHNAFSMFVDTLKKRVWIN